MSKKGFLVAIEGIDGSGKSTLTHAVHKKLLEHNVDSLVTQEPGGTPLGKELRVILHEKKELVCDKAEFLLFAAARAQHFEQVVIPALDEGQLVISDRMNNSSVAYQGYGRGLNVDMIKAVNRWAMCEKKPDLIFYIKLDFATGLERIMLRGGKLTSFEKEQELFWQRVNNGFNTIFENRSDVVELDGRKTPEALTELITDEILKRRSL